MCSIIGCVVLAALPAILGYGAELPKSWIDPDTGHRVVRLTTEPNSASLYFNQYGYTADGRKMVYTTPEVISALDLATYTTKSVVIRRVKANVNVKHTPYMVFRIGVT